MCCRDTLIPHTISFHEQLLHAGHCALHLNVLHPISFCTFCRWHTFHIHLTGQKAEVLQGYVNDGTLTSPVTIFQYCLIRNGHPSKKSTVSHFSCSQIAQISYHLVCVWFILVICDANFPLLGHIQACTNTHAYCSVLRAHDHA